METSLDAYDEDHESKVAERRKALYSARSTALAFRIISIIIVIAFFVALWREWPTPDGLDIPFYGKSTATVLNFIFFFVWVFLKYKIFRFILSWTLSVARAQESRVALLERRLKLDTTEHQRSKIASIDHLSARSSPYAVDTPVWLEIISLCPFWTAVRLSMSNKYLRNVSFHAIREIRLESWSPLLSDSQQAELMYDFLEKYINQERCKLKTVSVRGSVDTGSMADLIERLKQIGSVESLSAFVCRSDVIENAERFNEINRSFSENSEKWVHLRSLNLVDITRFVWLESEEPSALDAFRNLTHLTVFALHHTGDVTRLEKLKSLEFVRPSNKCLGGPFAFPTSLERLQVGLNGPLMPFMPLSLFNALSCLTNLKDLHISYPSPSASMDWIHPLENLEKISLNVFGAAVESFKSHCLAYPLKIRFLKLPSLPDFMVQLDNLTELDLQYVSFLPNEMARLLDLCQSQGRLKRIKRLSFDASQQFLDLDPITGATIVHLKRFHNPTFLFPRLKELHMRGRFSSNRTYNRHDMASAFHDLLTSMIDAGVRLTSLTVPTGFLSDSVWNIMIQDFVTTLNSLTLIGAGSMREWNRTPISSEMLSRALELRSLTHLACIGLIDVSDADMFHFITNHPSLKSWAGSEFTGSLSTKTRWALHSYHFSEQRSIKPVDPYSL